MSTDVMLVLDDYHVIDAREIHDGMVFLLDHLPPRLHLVIASRADPPLPLARLRARGELVEIRAADLRFTPDEAATYLKDTMGLDLTAQRCGSAGGAHRRVDRRAPAWRRCRCKGGRRRLASSRASPGTTATSSTTWWKRSCSVSPKLSGAFSSRPPSSTG